MSVIGPGSVSGFNLAGSIAGAQRNSAAESELKQTAADRKSQIDRNEAEAHATEDVGETETSPERDADGRRAYAFDDEVEEGELVDPLRSEKSDTKAAAQRRAVDPFGERGVSLDLDA